MKTILYCSYYVLFFAAALVAQASSSSANSISPVLAPSATAIQWSQIAAKAGADYQGDGLAVSRTTRGARIRCIFQRLEGEATPEGLWLISTTISPGGAVQDRFRVVAAAVGRAERGSVEPALNSSSGEIWRLAGSGSVCIDGQSVRFTRPGLVEEYSVSMDGVRQDFLVMDRPAGAGELTVKLAVGGARVEPAALGVRLVLDNSGRKLAYSRLRATDANGQELPARLEVQRPAAFSLQPSAFRLSVAVNDANAVYPVRIDPTFSDANWSSMGAIPGVDAAVLAAAVDSTGNIYIGGAFTAVGDTVVNGIAKWNGNSWSALGSGMDGAVQAVAASGSDLYAGGSFTTAGGIAATNIAKWNGSTWSALSSGLIGPADYPSYGGRVEALAVLAGNLYAGGGFTMAGDIAATNIAKWDGSSWSAVGSGISGTYSIFHPSANVYALAVLGSDLYAAGDFDTAGASAATNIAKWDGNSWSALGLGVDTDGTVYALAASGTNVYAGGSFATAGGSAANNIAKWDGSNWSPLDSGMGGSGYTEVHSLAVLGSVLYAGGYFTNAGGIAASNIARWDGSNWSALDSGVSGNLASYDPGVFALAVSGNNLYVGGAFTVAGQSMGHGIALWNGSSWSALGSALGSGIDGYVSALAVSGSDLYVGGRFTTIRGITAANIARWDGNSWSALDSGMNDEVQALAASGGELYAGGYFTTAGGIAANYIARWDGSGWSALGSDIGGFGGFPSVGALAVSGTNLYAGGQFSTAGGQPAAFIAQWNGSSWSALGSGVNGGVAALAVSGSDLYVGGFFGTAGRVPAANIAKWDGTSWSALGSGTSDGVSTLAVSDSGDLYAGGQFFNAGGVDVLYIARWDGNSWWALDSGIPGDYYYSGGIVSALAVSGSDLYVAGGDVTPSGNSPVPNIAKWDGSSWSPLGSAMQGDGVYGSGGVSALAVVGNDLYAAGKFTIVGGKVSANIARAYLLPLPTLSLSPSGTPEGGITVSWPSADTTDFSLEQADTPSVSASWVPTTASITDDGITKSVTLPATNSAQFFRLRSP